MHLLRGPALIRDRKDVLFKKYSPQVTKKIKQDLWQEICDTKVAEGVEMTKDVKHMREITWDNMKRKT